MKSAALILLLSIASHAQTLPRIALYSSAALDLGSTWNKRGDYIEANPLMGQTKRGQLFVMAGMTMLSDMAAQKMEPKRARNVRLIIVAMHVACATWNIKHGR